MFGLEYIGSVPGNGQVIIVELLGWIGIIIIIKILQLDKDIVFILIEVMVENILNTHAIIVIVTFVNSEKVNNVITVCLFTHSSMY